MIPFFNVVNETTPLYKCFTYTTYIDPSLEDIFASAQNGATDAPLKQFSEAYSVSGAPSLSVNNVIGINGIYYRVDPLGFHPVETINVVGDFEDWIALLSRYEN